MVLSFFREDYQINYSPNWENKSTRNLYLISTPDFVVLDLN